MPAGGEALISHRERLGRAVAWLDQQRGDDPAVVEEACRRFDLSPSDAEFLQHMWRERSAARRSGTGTD